MSGRSTVAIVLGVICIILAVTIPIYGLAREKFSEWLLVMVALFLLEVAYLCLRGLPYVSRFWAITFVVQFILLLGFAISNLSWVLLVAGGVVSQPEWFTEEMRKFEIKESYPHIQKMYEDTGAAETKPGKTHEEILEMYKSLDEEKPVSNEAEAMKRAREEIKTGSFEVDDEKKSGEQDNSAGKAEKNKPSFLTCVRWGLPYLIEASLIPVIFAAIMLVILIGFAKMSPHTR